MIPLIPKRSTAMKTRSEKEAIALVQSQNAIVKTISAMKTRSEKEAIALIQSQNAVVKTISASPTSNRCLDYMIDQLDSPSWKHRPVKPLGNVHRHRAFNPKTRQWVYRANEDAVRGAPKLTQFTKKTSTTLIPDDGKMHLFTPKHGDSVGLLFDVRQCHLKDEKYIFPTNANTDSKFWLKNKNQSEAEQALSIPETMSLRALQKKLAVDRLNDLIPTWNELTIGLSKNGLFAVFATNNQRDDRLKALHVKYYVMEKLGMDLPVLVITPQDGVLVYSVEWQQHDLLITKQYDYVRLTATFVKGLRQQFKALHPNLALKQDKQPLENFAAFLNSDKVTSRFKLEAWFFRFVVTKENNDMVTGLIKNNALPDKLEDHPDILVQFYKEADIDLLESIFDMPLFDYDCHSITAYTTWAFEGVTQRGKDMTLCPLLLAAIYRDEAFLSRMVERFPEKLVDALHHLNQVKKNYGWWGWPSELTVANNRDIDIHSANDISHTEAKLLAQLSSHVPSHKAYQLSYKEKRLVEDYLVRTVRTLNTEAELDAFWDQHKDSVCLNQKRHDIFDVAFRSKNHMTSIKKKLHNEIEIKRATLDENRPLRLEH